MPNNLTDKEIKKALECYRGQKLFAFNGKRPEIYIHDIIDLINRQEGENEKNENIIRVADKTIETLNAEIRHLDQESDILRADVENLNRICDEVNAENESLKAEVERLNNNISAMATTLSTSARATRHEAYKELAEKVKSEARYFAANVPDVCEVIDNLLNEFVGDGNSHNIDKQN